MTDAALPAPARPAVPVAVLLMLGFVATAPLIDVSAKLAARTLPVGEVTAARFVVQLAVMLPFALVAGSLAVPRGAWWRLALRGAMLLASTFCFVSAIDVMPLADALAITFVMPFVLLAMGAAMGERVGPQRVIASLVGFGGCLLVIEPKFDDFGLAALWPLGTAVTFALYMIVTRSLGARIGLAAMQVHTSWIAAAMALPVLALAEGSGHPALDPAWPQGWAWAWLAGTGVASALAHFLMTAALARAPSATLAPLNYLEIVAAVGFGYLIFGDLPNGRTWMGIALIVGAGLWVIARERRAASAGSP